MVEIFWLSGCAAFDWLGGWVVRWLNGSLVGGRPAVLSGGWQGGGMIERFPGGNWLSERQLGCGWLAERWLDDCWLVY